MIIVVALIVLLSLGGVCSADLVFEQTNLVSSVTGVAPVIDPNLKNPWGVAFGPTGAFSISNERTGTATQYDGNGAPQPTVITVPPAAASPAGTPGSPTGQVFNPTNDFQIPPLIGGTPAVLLFATLDGTISGWIGGATAQREVDNSASASSYTGLALANNGSGNFLYAANHTHNTIDVFSANFAPALGFPSFTDPTLPAGFDVYNIQNLGGTLFVTYENETTGGGIVDAFTPSGVLIRRISSNGAGGVLDSPWGLALAPAGFGPFGGALLVGNEGNGRISAFDPTTGQFLGQLIDAQTQPIANPGLWALTFGTGGLGGDPSALYFTAGIQGEREGLFGVIRPVDVVVAVPGPSSALLFGLGLLTAITAQAVRPRAAHIRAFLFRRG